MPLISLICKRLFSLLLALFAASVVIFLIVEILPGDPAEIMAGMNATPEQLAQLRHEYGLDLSPIPRYFQWITGILSGYMGKSYSYAVPVNQLVGERLTVSLPLAILSLCFVLIISFPVGFLLVTTRGGTLEKLIMFLLQIWVAVPNFLLGLFFIFTFSVTWSLFPGSGFPGWEEGLWNALSALILPALVLALPQAAILSRILRSSLLDVLSEDYIRTARAKGLSPLAALMKHALKNALPPVLTIMGLQFSFLVSGAIVVENVFSVSGLGKLMIQALNNRDLIVVESVGLLLVSSVIIVSYIVDSILITLDPRLRK